MGKPGTAVPGGQASDSRVPFWGRHSRSRVVVTSDPDSYRQTGDGRRMTRKYPNLLIVVPSDMPVAKAVQVLKGEVLALAR
jgi:hypothetical protein